MRTVVQRVSRAGVTTEGREIARIGRGLLVLAGIEREDTGRDLEWMVRKIVELRIFDDTEGKLNSSLLDIGGELLIVSQFTLLGDCRKGRRPSYSKAAPPQEAAALYQEFVEQARRAVSGTQTGKFQAMMSVDLVNEGPVTLVLDSRLP